MPAKDFHHDSVKRALAKDGWSITHDPLVLKAGTKDLFVDLGAERLLAAERAGEKIAVEVKSFGGPSDVADLERALGQFVLYSEILLEQEPDRVLFLAIPRHAWDELFEEPIGKILLEKRRLRLVVYDVQEESIIRWTS